MNNSKLSQLNMLVVDDEFIAQHVFSAFLAELTKGDIQVADNGLEALERLKKYPIDFMLTDINMPKMNGIELTKAIRESKEAYKDIFILGITGNDNPDILNDAKNAGMNAVLVKPISPEQLADAMHNILSLVS